MKHPFIQVQLDSINYYPKVLMLIFPGVKISNTVITWGQKNVKVLVLNGGQEFKRLFKAFKMGLWGK